MQTPAARDAPREFERGEREQREARSLSGILAAASP